MCSIQSIDLFNNKIISHSGLSRGKKQAAKPIKGDSDDEHVEEDKGKTHK